MLLGRWGFFELGKTDFRSVKLLFLPPLLVD